MSAKTKRLIEILPGIRIEVTERLKERADLTTRQRRETKIRAPDQTFIDLQRAKRKGIKYSRLILDEAVALAKERGLAEAVRLTGVNRWSIELHDKRLRQQKGACVRQPTGSRYTMEQKQACVALAMALMQAKNPLPRRPAFVEAGKRLGMNGRSIEWMWVCSMIPPPSTPQPASPPGA